MVGPEVPGVHARDTRRVFEELVDGAQRAVWVSAYTFYDGPKAFKQLAQRMDAVPTLQVTLLLNIQRKAGDTSEATQLVKRFADNFWKHAWPGERRPAVFYDPRSLSLDNIEGVLHAKALVVDDAAAFVTSANLTEAAFDRNLELGVLSHDRTLAAGLSRHFRALVDQGYLVPLPSSSGSTPAPRRRYPTRLLLPRWSQSDGAPERRTVANPEPIGPRNEAPRSGAAQPRYACSSRVPLVSSPASGDVRRDASVLDGAQELVDVGEVVARPVEVREGKANEDRDRRRVLVGR